MFHFTVLHGGGVAMKRGTIVFEILAALACLVASPVTRTLWAQEEPGRLVQTLGDVESPADMVVLLAHAYRSMDLELYGALFAHEPGQGVGFRSVLNRPTEQGENDWGYDEEMRIHRRMFRPQTIGADEKPLPRELWVRSIEVQLQAITSFQERYDLYISEHNPMGELDRKQWRATDAVYATDVTWFTEGGATMHVVGQARFIVIEDRQASLGEPGKFRIYRWEDLGAGEVGVARSRP
jgi:hypothetical protein